MKNKMNRENFNAQNGVASSAQKESYSKIEIRKGENDGIYRSYGTTEETLRQAGAAILQFSDLGFNVEKITDNCWKATHNNYEPVWIEVESFEWYGLQNEIDGMCECIRDNFKETVGISSTEAENVAKLRNVSYDEVYELFDNMEDNPMIDLGNGVYVQITDESGIWDLGIETTDGNYRHTIGDFGDNVVCLLAGEENYIDHLTYTLNEYINSVNEEKEA